VKKRKTLARRPFQSSQPTLTKDAVLEHLASHPGDTKRDIARALKVKGSERQILKHILSELADQGTIEKGRRRSFVPSGELPEVAVLEIFGEDPDGEPLGRPGDRSTLDADIGCYAAGCYAAARSLVRPGDVRATRNGRPCSRRTL